MSKRRLIDVLFLLIIFGLTVYYIFYGQDVDLQTLFEKICEADIRWLLLAVVAIIAHIFSESCVIHFLFKDIGIYTKRFTCFLYSCVGFFFCCITPSSTGGQPAQMFYMKKNNIPVSISSVVMMIITIAYKLVLVVVGLFLILFDHKFIDTYLKDIMFFFILGIVINVVFVGFMFLILFNQTVAKKLIRGVLYLLKKIHLLKKSEKLEKRIDNFLNSYTETARYLKSHVAIFIKALLITAFERFSYFFVTYFVYKSYGLSGSSMYVVVMLQCVISLSVDMLPLPGGMGITEVLFKRVYLPIFGPALLFPGMILSRSLTFYTELILCAVFTLFAHIYIGRFTKKEIEQMEAYHKDFSS